MGPPPLKPTRVAIGLGSSLGDPFVTLGLAVACLDALPRTEVVATSRVYLSPPAGGTARRAFHNAVVVVATTWQPDELLRAVKVIERRLGRRPARPQADRRVDLDLLLWEGRVVVGTRLVLPHPRITSRPFVLLPLRDAWPDAPDGWTGRPLRDLPTSALPVVGTLRRPTVAR